MPKTTKKCLGISVRKCKRWLKTKVVIDSLTALLTRFTKDEVWAIYELCLKRKKYPEHCRIIVKYLVFGKGGIVQFSEDWQDKIEPYLLFIGWIEWRKKKNDRILGDAMTYKELEDATGMDDLRYWNLEKDGLRVLRGRYKN